MRKLKLLPLLLAAMLLLCACGDVRFTVDDAGQGYTDSKTKTYYAAMPDAFEAGSREGEAIGSYEDGEYEYSLDFYAIADVDAKNFITDGYGRVYTALSPMPEFSALSVGEIAVCDEDAVSIELYRITEKERVAALKTLWTEGEATDLPMLKASFKRRLKFALTEYPNIYYCVTFYTYESGEGYLYDAATKRAVLCPAEVTAALYNK